MKEPDYYYQHIKNIWRDIRPNAKWVAFLISEKCQEQFTALSDIEKECVISYGIIFLRYIGKILTDQKIDHKAGEMTKFDREVCQLAQRLFPIYDAGLSDDDNLISSLDILIETLYDSIEKLKDPCYTKDEEEEYIL
jgi:hypothetical protein